MSEVIKIVVEAREETGKEACGRMRREGSTPVVIYGPKIAENLLGKVNTKSMMPYLTAEDCKAFTFDLECPCGSVKRCVIKSATKNFSNDEILHIDFYCAD